MAVENPAIKNLLLHGSRAELEGAIGPTRRRGQGRSTGRYSFGDAMLIP